ncbi:hypothetical protein G7046_g7467 [Stylonectria norvegica]|nr:hypothetical protein G7046_g7467 [Stylonectria norvegica]
MTGALLGHVDTEGGLNVIDFCTGTGCIPLLLFSNLQPYVWDLKVKGIDISPEAIKLARENLAINTRSGNLFPGKPAVGQSIAFSEGDVFDDKDIQKLAASRWDLLISNPPYISQDVWDNGRGQLGYSVRKYEPRLALVPHQDLPRPVSCNHADAFYARLLDVAVVLDTKVVFMEIGDEDQACRVLQLYFRHTVAEGANVELWRDWPDSETNEDDATSLNITTLEGREWSVPVRGTGLVRSILIRRLPEGSWVT